MAITWFLKEPKKGVATLCSTNITLNKPSISNFENVGEVCLGIEYATKRVYIKPYEEGMNVPTYKISIASSYGRITNKEFMKEISNLIDVNFTNPLKVPTTWDEKEKVLVLYLTGKVNK